jgi:hypothetical protein
VEHLQELIPPEP